MIHIFLKNDAYSIDITLKINYFGTIMVFHIELATMVHILCWSQMIFQAFGKVINCVSLESKSLAIRKNLPSLNYRVLNYRQP